MAKKCMFCDTKQECWDKTQSDHLIVSKIKDNGHIHIHGTDNANAVKEMINRAIGDYGLKGKCGEETDLELKEVVFHNRQRIGDVLMFTAGVRDFKKAYPNVRINVISTAAHIWDNNINIDRSLVPTEQNTLKIGTGKLTNASNRLDWHFANAFRVSIEDALKISIPQGPTKPDIWLTEEEYNAPRTIEKPYWIMVIGGEKGWGCKMYPFERWQAFVDQNSDILFYQLGAQEDHQPRLKGKNVVDYIGKTQDRNTGIRDLFKLFLHAEGSIGLISFQTHLSAAFGKPCIVVAGAREPVSFTRYPGHQYLATDGCLPCAVKACWHCDINTCTDLVIDDSKQELLDRKVPKCVDLIKPEDLTRALNSYYEGGRLKKGVPSPKPKFTNLVKEPVNVIPPKIPKSQRLPQKTEWGLSFDDGSITALDWEFMEKIISVHKIKTVLEFGTGLSTLLMKKKGLKLVSYETHQPWIDRIKNLNPDCDIRLWDGKNLDLKEKFDLAFVDGPPGAGAAGFPPVSAREQPIRISSEAAEYLIIHDAQRKPERMWQEKYVAKNFKGPMKGGHRCHFWRKFGENESPKLAPKPNISRPQPGKKSIKIVSTARGWGGCARSVTTIMKYLLEDGHEVEFIPFRNRIDSREYRDYISNELTDLIVTENYETLNGKCDVLFVYADDYVWEFGQPRMRAAFSNLNAKHKIMMVNYRRGKVGELDWTKNWDKYMFLNSGQERDLLSILPGIKTKVLPPCTELEEFFNVKPDFGGFIRLVRHSSQGDTKFAKDFDTEILNILSAQGDVEIHMMPGPSFVKSFARVKKYPRNKPPISEFLAKGNLFWYSLPKGYMDMGPRVILEAMASGLPILADNWGGVVDRVTPECGWLCDTKEQHVEIIKNVTLDELKKKGHAARERARKEFVPTAWVKEITDVQND